MDLIEQLGLSNLPENIACFEDTFGENKGKDVEFLLEGENLLAKKMINLRNSLKTIKDVQKTLSRLLAEDPDRDCLMELGIVLDLVEENTNWQERIYENIGSILVEILAQFHADLNTYDYNVLVDINVLLSRISTEKSLYSVVWERYKFLCQQEKKSDMKEEFQKKINEEIMKISEHSKKIKKKQHDEKKQKNDKRWKGSKPDGRKVEKKYGTFVLTDFDPKLENPETKLEYNPVKIEETSKPVKQEYNYRSPVEEEDNPMW